MIDVIIDPPHTTTFSLLTEREGQGVGRLKITAGNLK